MPKQQLKITDFSGGLNAFADARDIQDTQFAQNWNASLDKYGVVRFTGAGVKYTTDHPHTNNNFVPGGGLFAFSTDISANVLDGTDLQKGFEKGIVGAYSGTSLTLAQTPTFNTQANHDLDNFYNNMIVHIYDGPGKGQSSLITGYTGSTNVATVTAFGLDDDGGSIVDNGIDGNAGTDNVAAVAKLRVYAEGGSNNWVDGVHWSTGQSFLGSLFPWGIMGGGFINSANLFTDVIALGRDTFGFFRNGKKLIIRDRDGKVLTIIFINAGTTDASVSTNYRFPGASADGSVHYKKVTTFSADSTEGLGLGGVSSWTDGDRIFSTNTNEEYYILNVQNRTNVETTADIATIINAENGGSGVNVSAVISFDEDGNRTILTLTADKGAATFKDGEKCLDVEYVSHDQMELQVLHLGELEELGFSFEELSALHGAIIGSGNRDAELEVFQNFTGGFGASSDSYSTSATLTKISSVAHSVNIGEYITLRGTYSTSGYDDVTFRVVWIEPDAIYIESTLGDSNVSSGTFETVPDTTSRYIIYNLGAVGWDFSDSYQGSSLISNKSSTSTTVFSKQTL